jgi:hypothetical protein
MVEERTTDPTRVAQLLASELTGLETGPLAGVTLENADPDAVPTPGGTGAYEVAHQGARVGTVSLYPDGVVVSLSVDPGAVPEDPAVPVESTGEGLRVRVADGVAVKPAVDVLRRVLSDSPSA